MNNFVFTIGHSNHDITAFVNLLLANKIELLIDVRSTPYSKIYPHFNMSPLEVSLTNSSIKYIFLGNSLGGRSNSISDYSEGRVMYDRLAQKEEYISSINELISISAKYKTVLMCSEKEPLECHRALLISKSIEMHNVKIFHIHRDGHIESQSEAIQRLLKIWKLDTPNLFGEDIERIDEALAKQEGKYAYFDENKII
jgi:uncharacterized protein (DUF488 family)